jgi:hypothetical protein
LLLIILLVLTSCFLKPFLYLFIYSGKSFFGRHGFNPNGSSQPILGRLLFQGEMLGGLDGEVLNDTLVGGMATKCGARGGLGGLNYGRSNIGS